MSETRPSLPSETEVVASLAGLTSERLNEVGGLPKHEYGSTVEQVHRVLTTEAYREVDPWLVAEAIVALVSEKGRIHA